MIYQKEFLNTVLFDPIEQGADKLKIVSGYASPSMASWHIMEIYERKKKPVEISLIVGMCNSDGLSSIVHEGFKSIMTDKCVKENKSLFNCQYVIEGSPVHSKLYVWERKNEPILAYMGSANYSQIAFSRERREIVQKCDPLQALNYFNTIEANSMYCNRVEVEEFIRISKPKPCVPNSAQAPNTLKLSLLTTHNDVGFGSGINWGHRRNGIKREPNQMYISLPAFAMRTGFFPLDNQHFSVLTDDGVHFVLSVQQQNNKGITTPLNNSHIGEYFRNRIGVSNGAFVTKQDLLDYGRTDVEFIKIDDEQYFMNFSIGRIDTH